MQKSTTRLIVISAILSLFVFSACQQDSVDLSTETGRVSYAIGVDIGTSIKAQFAQQNFEKDPDVLAAGIRDVLADAELKMGEEERVAVLTALNERMIAEQQAKDEEALGADEEAQKNKKAGEDFLAENAKRDGVVVLPSGLQYEIVTEGTGDLVGLTATVQAHYELSFPGQDPWQSSYESGTPFRLQLVDGKGGAIKGWLEAIPMMKKGSKWKIYIPFNLGYGPKGSSPNIPAFQTLVFTTEIVDIEK